MTIEFDPDKDAANLAKHHVSLAFAEKIFDDVDYVILPTIRPSDGEERFKAFGSVDGKLWTVVHTFRGNKIRVISVRRSNAGEQRAYRSYSSGFE